MLVFPPALQTSEYNANEKRVIWNIKKFPGATEQMLRIKVRFKAKGMYSR